ncbi:MAG: hypothetical protein RLY46_124 [Bacteroidota bacterium]
MNPDTSNIPPFFHRYIQLVPDTNLITLLREQEKSFSSLINNIPTGKWDFSYEQDKWTIRELSLHCIDTERIFAYRALCIARKEKVHLPSFDENAYAHHSKAQNRGIESLKEEFSLIRKTTTILFEEFDQEQLESEGNIGDQLIYVGGIGYIIVGHLMHHERILRERYLK